MAAPPCWFPAVDPSILIAQAVEANDNGDGIDLMGIGHPVTVFRDDSGAEHVRLGYPPRPAVRLYVEAGTVLGGPVRLCASVTQCASPPGSRTLHRLFDLRRFGRVRAHHDRRDTRADRLAFVLQVLDGCMAGASQRRIAIALFGEQRVREDWNGWSDYLRGRICRAIVAGVALRDGGYLHLLRGVPEAPQAANDNDPA